MVAGVLLQVIDVDDLQARDQQLELSIVEDLDQITRHDSEEAVLEGGDLPIDGLLQPVVGHQSDVLLLVCIGDESLGAAFAKISCLCVAEIVLCVDEVGAEMLGSLVLQDPGERLVQLRVIVLQVSLVESHVKDKLVERLDEVAVQQLLVHQGLADELTDEGEQVKVVGLHHRLGIREVGRARRGLEEQCHVFIEHMLAQQGEPLLGQAALVDTSLVLERDPQGSLPVVGLRGAHQCEAVIEGLVSAHQDVQ